jgi:mannitol/fructose-specific phosphotransferase system IIA component
VLTSGSGLRAASKVIELITSFFSIPTSFPCWQAGRFWLMRLGYYKLHRPKERADDWVWIIDHTMQLGSDKCLLIVGIRLCNLPNDRALCYTDIEPIELIPVTKSNGEIVYEQLEIAKEKTGIPREIISDHGSDIKLGIEKFCNAHKETCYVYDIKHAMSIAFKKELEKDKIWERFVTLSAKIKREIYQTPLSPLIPPNQRKKARYMNADTLISWGEKIQALLNQPDEIVSKNYDVKKIREKFSRIEEFSSKITEWNNLLKVIRMTEDYVRENGLNWSNSMKLEIELNQLNLDINAIKFKENAINFVKKESLKAKAGERLLGSSEIIESLFGKQKFIEKEQSKSGFTGLILALPACLSETSESIIKKALESIPTKFVIKWCKKYIVKSIQAKRAEAFKIAKSSEQKWNQFMIAA